MVVGSLFCACQKVQYDQDQLVVEGWICQQGHPMVFIHKSYALNNPNHKAYGDASFEEIMADQMIVWGKVTIDDGQRQVVLTGKMDTLYTPPIYFTTTDIIGEIGKTYRITVDYQDYHASAYSTIQEPIKIDSLSVRLTPDRLTSHVTAYLSHLPPSTYLLAEYRAEGELQYTICPLGTASSDQMRDGVLSMNILSKNPDPSAMTSAVHHFETNNKEYTLRIIHLNYEQYQYFSALTNQLATQGMFFMSTFRNIPSNIDQGIGYWAGFGKNDYFFFVNKDTTYIF